MTRKEICRQLAERLEERPTQEVFRWLQMLGLSGSSSEQPTPSQDHRGREETPGPISIWQPRKVEGKWIFERPEPDPLGDHFSVTRRWSAEKEPGVRRVCFFGESVAAGYLYAPYITPAQVLGRCLSSDAKERVFEVVDLARTNETLGGLLGTLRSSLQLSPDVLVIFAGNNWNLLETPELSPYRPSVRGRQRYGEVLESGGPKALMKWAGQQLERKATGALDAIAALARQKGIPVIWVLPEVNLAHWHSRQPVAWLSGDGSQRWHELYRSGCVALQKGQAPEAEEAARGMLELDAGCCPTSYRLLAEALLAQQCWLEAEAACRAEVDAEVYSTLCFLGSPRATRQVRQVVEACSKRHGFVLVDLPEVFRQGIAVAPGEEAAAAKLPGRRLFLDYCHLTLEGIDLAMAAVGEAVRSVFARADGDSSLKVLGPHSRPEPTSVDPEVEALAALGAAIHSAHRLLSLGSKAKLLGPWIQRALRASPGVVEAFRDLVMVRGGPSPEVLSEAHGRNRRSSYPLSLQHGWKWEFMDAELLSALLGALEDVDPGACLELRKEILQSCGLSRDFIDLSRAPFLWEPLERFYPEAMPRSGLTGRAALRCPWPTTDFCVVTSSEAKVDLELEVRLPQVEGMTKEREGEAILEVDGRHLGRLAVGKVWRIHHQTVPPGVFSEGLNKLTLRWPPLPSVGDLARAEAIRRLQLGIEADIHPVFGEIFRLRARLHG